IRRDATIPPLAMVTKGQGFVAVQLEGTVVIGAYFSPNRPTVEFGHFLGGIGAIARRLAPRPVILAGDLNAKSVAWGSPRSDARGRLLERWANAVVLCLLNRGSVATCVRWQGESIVDVTFASPAIARRIRDWRVLEGAETLSDHRYIRFDLSARSTVADVHGDHPRSASRSFPKWALKRLNKELLMEASTVAAWAPMRPHPVEVEDEAGWFRDTMRRICDVSMPRISPRPPNRQVYWWSPEIAQLRVECVRARRQCARHRRRRLPRRNDPVAFAVVEAQLYGAF
ncbi:hypothetical protein FEC36_18505, partial [Acinetobacter baumannii]